VLNCTKELDKLDRAEEERDSKEIETNLRLRGESCDDSDEYDEMGNEVEQ